MGSIKPLVPLRKRRKSEVNAAGQTKESLTRTELHERRKKAALLSKKTVNSKNPQAKFSHAITNEIKQKGSSRLTEPDRHNSFEDST